MNAQHNIIEGNMITQKNTIEEILNIQHIILKGI